MFKKFAIQLINEISAECEAKIKENPGKAEKFASVRERLRFFLTELRKDKLDESE